MNYFLPSINFVSEKMISFTVKLFSLTDEEYNSEIIVCDSRLPSITIATEYYRDGTLHYCVANSKTSENEEFEEALHKCISSRAHDVWSKLSTL